MNRRFAAILLGLLLVSPACASDERGYFERRGRGYERFRY